MYFYTEDNYENKLFEALAYDAAQGVKKDNNDSILIINSLHVVHDAIKPRTNFFSSIGGLKGGVIQPLTVDLMTGQGACGSYAVVMARLLEELNIDTRIVQMKVGEVYGGHNIVEARYKDNWIVLDPLYDLYFTRPDATLASFNDVQHNWNYYTAQLPKGYDMRYSYEHARYTNWNKIPVLMPLLKGILNVFMGKEKADTFSLRAITLRKFWVFFLVTLFFQLGVIGYIIRYKYKKRKLSTNIKPTSQQVEEPNVNVYVISPAKTPTSVSQQ